MTIPLKHPIFYFSRFRPWDYWTILLYLVLSVAIFWGCNGTINLGDPQNLLFGYAFGTHFFFYFLNYKSLRNFSVYLIWLLIGAVHFTFHLRGEIGISPLDGHSSAGLRNTILLLLIFQTLRILSLKVQGQEFVAIMKGSKEDLFDERRFNILDLVIFLVYWGAMVGLNMWT